jgi:hypothetical protein
MESQEGACSALAFTKTLDGRRGYPVDHRSRLSWCSLCAVKSFGDESSIDLIWIYRPLIQGVLKAKP